MVNLKPQYSHSFGVDEYQGDRVDSLHFAPRLIVEKPVLPNLTVWVSGDGKGGMFQRWYDVTPDVLSGVGVRSVDFVPDGVVRLVDRDSNEIARASSKLTDDFAQLPLVLARIEKMWEHTISPAEFWQKACAMLVQSQIPTFAEIVPGVPLLTRQAWMALACHWAGYLARVRDTAGHPGWGQYRDGDQLLLKYVDFWNSDPSRGPDLSLPKYSVDRVVVAAQLNAARRATTNYEKKRTFEGLAETVLAAVPDFRVLPGCRTATGEIDRLVRNTSMDPILCRLNTLIYVECKNWHTTVGTDPLGSFITDLNEAGLQCGIFFMRKPVSKEAWRRVLTAYQTQKTFVLLITERDLESICEGASLAAMLIEKMEELMLGRERHI